MSFNFTFGDITNQSILQFDSRCLIVATPQGTPSPPDVTSTVARPHTAQSRLKKSSGFTNYRNKLQVAEIEEGEELNLIDASYVQPAHKPSSKLQRSPEEQNFNNFSIPTRATTTTVTTAQAKVQFDQASRFAPCGDRSSLGILPPDKFGNTTMTNNQTFSNEIIFGFGPGAKVNVPSHIEAKVQNPSPPTPDLAEQHALNEFQRLRLTKSPNRVTSKSPSEGQEKSLNGAPNKSSYSRTIFASVNNSAETVIQRKLSEMNNERLIDIKMGISEVSHNKSSNIGHLQPLSPSESSVFLETAQPSYESSVARGAQVAASNSFESSVVGGAALPFKYLLPTPHHNSNETNTIRGLSYYLDSTCDSSQIEDGGETHSRVEFPSGVEPLITPQWQRGDSKHNHFQLAGVPIMEKIPEDQGDELSQSEEDRDGTRDERFSDFSDPPSCNMHSPEGRNSRSAEADNLTLDEIGFSSFASLPPQDFSFGVGENFTAMTNEGIKDFMDAEEEENANDFRFIQDEEVPDEDKSSAVTDSANQSPGFQASLGKDSENNGSSGSMSEYFRAGTSRIGHSFEHSSSGSSLQRHRPSFGLGTFRSPQRQPVAVVTAMTPPNGAISPSNTGLPPSNTATLHSDSTTLPSTSKINDVEHDYQPDGTPTSNLKDKYGTHYSVVNEDSEVNPSIQHNPSAISSDHQKAESMLSTTFVEQSSATFVKAKTGKSVTSPQTDQVSVTSKNSFAPESRHFNQCSFVTPENRHYAESSFAKHASRVPLGNDSADLEYIVSFLEQTVMQTLTNSGIQDPKEASHELIAKIIAQATPGINAREYATRVINALRHKSHFSEMSPNTTTSVMHLLPSFITNTTFIEFKENVVPKNVDKSAAEVTRQKMVLRRHSSPKKLQDRQTSFSSLAIDLAKSRLAMSQISSTSHFVDRDDIFSSTKKPISTEFPIECNRQTVFWVGGQNQEQQVTIRNILNDQAILLNLMVRDSNEFYFSHKKRALQLTIQPGETKKVPLTFCPKGEGTWSRGKLVLKPQGYPVLGSDPGRQRIKAAIPLNGFSGHPQLVFESSAFVQQSNHKQVLKLDPNTVQAQIRVCNTGSASGFVRFTGNNVRISPGQFVLESGKSLTCSVTAKPNEKKYCNVIGKVTAVHGSEIARHILRKVSTETSNEFVEHFDSENESTLNNCDLRGLGPDSAALFYDSLERFECDVSLNLNYGALQPIAERELQFYRLQPEETFMTDASFQSTCVSTLQETRGPAVSAAQKTHSFQRGQLEMAVFGTEKNQIYRGVDFSLVEAKLARPLDGTGTTNRSQTHPGENRNRVYLAEQQLSITGNSIAKISILNRTQVLQRFTMATLSPPFYSFHEEVQVKPYHYLHIPVKFSPEIPVRADKFEYETQAIFRNMDNGIVLICKLIGRIQK